MSLFNKFEKLMAAPTIIPTVGPTPSGPTSTVQTPSMGKEDVIEFLKDDDEKKEILDIEPRIRDKGIPETDDKGKDDKDEKDEEEEVSEEDELKELEQELEGPTDEQLELIAPVRRKEILKKYPQLFKDFPYLEKAYYREQQFTELLPTIDDAKIAVNKAQILDRFEADVMNGNTETLLSEIRQGNPKGFNKIVDDYLPTLARVDEKAYHHVLSNVIKHTIVAMVREGQRSNNDVLKSAAQILNQFTFGSSDFTPPSNLTNENDAEEKYSTELQQREMMMNRRQLDSTVDDLNTKVNNTLKNTIDAHLDPRGSMTDYVKKNASREAMEHLEGLITKDSRFKALADKLWEKAMQDGFSKTSVDRIKSAYLAKAKTLLPTVIKKARNEALRGLGKRVNDDEDSTPASSSNRSPVSVGRPRSSSSGKITKASDIPKGMRTIDFLNMD